MSEYTTTPNLGLYKPVPGEDDDVWGDHINANSDTLDSALAGGPWLPIVGGTLTGMLKLPATSPTDPQHAVTKAYADSLGGGGGGGIAEAPNDSAFYARRNLGWAAAVGSFNTRTGPVTLTSADVTTALTFTPYNATNPSGYQTAANVTTTLAPYALTSALPLAASATPLVESGAGAVGTGTTWARADHVHPAGGGGGGGIAEAPTDGTIYGRQGSTTSWLGVLPLTGGSLQKSVALSGNSDIVLSVGDSTTARNQPLTYSYTAGASSGAVSRLGFNVYANSSGTITRANTAKGGWHFELDNRDAQNHGDILLRATTAAGVTTSPHTFGATGNFIITNNMQVGGVYRTSGGVQVLQARIGGWGATAPVNGVRVNNFDATTATLPQVAQALAALLVDLRTHGVIGT